MAGKKTSGSTANDASMVDTYMAQLNHPRKAEIEALRALILGVDARITESIKWNAPSFATTEHFATFRLQPRDMVQLVFHTGAKLKSNPAAINIEAPPDLLTWVTTDRCTITFSGMDDVDAKAAALQAVVRQWIAQV